MLNKLKKIPRKDVLGIFKFIIILIPALFYRIYIRKTNKKLWLICETEKTACDNGYIFYQYMIKQHPEINCYYAINKKSVHYNKLSNKQKVIQWGSLRHYYIYIAATSNISSHKEGNPNHSIFTFLHLYLNLFNDRVFLQHGVLYQDFPMFYQKNTKFKIFICGAKPEFNFVVNNYGYKNNEVKYTGLARFDNLYDFNTQNIILLIPTWRRQLDTEEKFVNSMYFKKLISFLNNKNLDILLEKNGTKLIFYPHSQEYKKLFSTNLKNVEIVNDKNVDIQDLLKFSSLMITDYSSVATDFAYMKKPIIYYQYDEKDYSKHIGNSIDKSYFNFENDGFGPVVKSEEKLLNEIEYYLKNNYEMKKEYLKRIDGFFELHDNNNCYRIYKEILRSEG